MKIRKYILIGFVVALAVVELLYQLGATSYGSVKTLSAFYRFFNIVSNLNL